jgi:hexosaminidase
MFKILSLLFATTFLVILYILMQKKSSLFLLDEDDFHYEAQDFFSHYKPTPMSTDVLTNIKIIPMPMSVNTENSTLVLSSDYFRIASTRKPAEDLHLAILRYSKYISLITGLSTKIDDDVSPSGNALIIDCPLKNLKQTKYPKVDEDEFYTLNITKTGSYLYALSLTGVIRGLSTFVQLIERDSASNQNSIPLVNIVDRPRFTWRGLLLDVSRHWMPVPVIERTLNAMELSKLNVLHLHLSDDQGFRVESIEHKLLHDKQDFFTQKDIRHLVEYARRRRIRIVPEFDIPGHTTR